VQEAACNQTTGISTRSGMAHSLLLRRRNL
jgi:hypothetical protein